jgi:signal transduction histidine kinase
VTSLSKPFEGRATSFRPRPPAFTRTVRFRLSVWYSSLLLVFGIAFVVALNVALRMDRPNEPEQVIDRIGIQDVQFVAMPEGPGQAVSSERPVVTLSVLLRDAQTHLNDDTLNRLQTWSILAVFSLAIASGIGGYIMSGVMLRPVRDITRVASSISATNLNERINHQGPDDELKDLADTFDLMISRLETSFESQRRFIQYASHELRTPLAAIRTNIEVTEMDPEVSPEEYRELLDTVKAQTNRLTHLSDDLLLLTSTESDPPEMVSVEAVAVCRDALTQLEGLAERNNIALRMEGPGTAMVTGHPELLYRCVFNLVDNAIKYSGEGSNVTVRVSQPGAQTLIEVTDTGPGIPEQYWDRVFDRFFRVDKSLSRKSGGSGLGLAIVKEVVEMMDGTVTLRSEANVGTSFLLTLPSASQHP